MEKDLQIIIDILKKIPNYWDGKQCVTEMLNGGIVGWRDNAWEGRYFEYLCQRFLKGKIAFKLTPKIMNTAFDASDSESHIDFKVCSYDPKRKNTVSLNDYDSMLEALRVFKKIQYVFAVGSGINSLEFNNWQDGLKIKVDGSLSSYSKRNRELGIKPRLRKKLFIVEKIILFEFNENSMKLCNQTQKGWKNSGGALRKPKFSLDLDYPKIQQFITELVVFNNKQNQIIQGLDVFTS